MVLLLSLSLSLFLFLSLTYSLTLIRTHTHTLFSSSSFFLNFHRTEIILMPVYTLVAIRWDSKRTMNKFVECKLLLLLLLLVLIFIFFFLFFLHFFFFNQQLTRDKVHRRTVRLLETLIRVEFVFFSTVFLFWSRRVIVIVRHRAIQAIMEIYCTICSVFMEEANDLVPEATTRG